MSADRGVYQPPPEDIQVYDPAEDEEQERSRLPILIVIALLVLAAFGGVVWLAYNQGVARGRADAPRVIAADEGPIRTAPEESAAPEPLAGLKIYNDPVPPEEEAAGTETPAPAPALPSELASAPTEAAVPPAAEPAPITMQPAPAPEPQPAPTVAAPVVTGTGVLLQIGSFPDEASASAAWTTFQRKHAITLSGFGPDIKAFDLGEKGTWYRLRVGPFADKATANATCAKLKEEGAAGCFTAAP
ncbi:MAG: SPOR domain-containing protein [Alphaproteobacteria bacterium]